MSDLVITDLQARVEERQILFGVTLTVRGGEVHAVMGPNGSGKSTLSHVLMGKPGYEVLGGSVTLDGVDLLALEPWERARAGLFLAMQYPVEVPGVALEDVLVAAGQDRGGLSDRVGAEFDRVGLDRALLGRSLNVDLSGGEKKRAETVQLGVIQPKIAILDEIDSGLDVDALRAVSRRVEAATTEDGLGVLAITHYNRLLEELHPDVVHIFAGGRILESGGPELANRLEAEGYGAWLDADADAGGASGPSANGPASEDPFADPFA
jgi:Fe-S cluster assembly ATP-binding protein